MFEVKKLLTMAAVTLVILLVLSRTTMGAKFGVAHIA